MHRTAHFYEFTFFLGVYDSSFTVFIHVNLKSTIIPFLKYAEEKVYISGALDKGH